MSLTQVVDAARQIGEGLAKQVDGNPTNNVKGLKDIAQGVVVTAQVLDDYLKQNGLDLSQISFPGANLLDPKELTNEVLKQAITNGIKKGLEEESPEEKERKQREAEKKAKEAETKKKQAEEAELAARKDRERREFLEGDGDRIANSKRGSRAKVSMI